MATSVLPGPSSTTPLLTSYHSRSRSPSPNPTTPTHLSLGRLRRRRAAPPIHYLPAVLLFSILAFFSFIVWDISSIGNCYIEPLCRILGEGREGVSDVWWRNGGAYSPRRAMGPGGGSKNLPRGCSIDQVNILHRHTARYPTTSAGKCMQQALAKLENRGVDVPRRHPELAFLSRADLKMEGWKFDQLMDQGRKAAWRSGRELAGVYKHLLKTGDGLFTRSAGGSRVVETSGYWLQGFRGSPFKIRHTDELEQVDVVLPEGNTYNNTLAVHNCPAYENAEPSPGLAEQTSLYPLLDHTLDRLNAILHPLPALTHSDLLCLADMCPYDSQRVDEDWTGWSKWCGIFDRAEWEILGHAKDVKRYYEVGEGSLYGKTMGAGWINELLARLTDKEVRDETTVNKTLDGDEATFPRGGMRMAVDFTHDNEMIEILTAMNVIPQHRPLPTDSVPDKRTYQTSYLIPFGSRIIVERIGCRLAGWEPDPNTGDDGREKDGKKDYVRILINDKVHAVDHVDCKQSGFFEHKMCELELFVGTQTWSSNEVDWGLCYGDQKPDDE
ncbi:histidine phosphatase superfamily [Naematelia encephala]|uniref:Histidine phosphatase superfamily n=1 Tax=Naematelia encephala TaxID=71784 RepID=A0A1Y2BHR0_9TREE|nr:histidine phosphatase superfamily [Naematelia encephala]